MTPAQVDIFNGDTTSLRTSVYLRATLPAVSDPQRYQLRGTIDGPYSDYAQTLPANYQLSDCGPGESLLAKATIPDPCVWTPATPVRYRLEFELCRDAEPIENGSCEFGLRDLATDQRSIFLAGKRTVIRGIGYERARFTELLQWRDTASAMLVTDPDEALCEKASRTGVVIVAHVTATVNLEDRVRRIAAHPSTTIVWLGNGCAHRNWRRLAPNVLFARSYPLAADDETCDMLVCEISHERPPQLPTNISKPLLALRPLQQRTPLSAARAACDTLQRDLAPQVDLAGYLV